MSNIYYVYVYDWYGQDMKADKFQMKAHVIHFKWPLSASNVSAILLLSEPGKLGKCGNYQNDEGVYKYSESNGI